MTSRKSSGSSREASAVEPTRSQNITVSWRRSALSARGGAGIEAGAGGAVSPTGFPQPPQNFAVGSFSKPQTGHGEGSGAPHSAQKRLLAAFSAMQLGQRIGAPCVKRSRASIIHPRVTLKLRAGTRPDELINGSDAARG